MNTGNGVKTWKMTKTVKNRCECYKPMRKDCSKEKHDIIRSECKDYIKTSVQQILLLNKDACTNELIIRCQVRESSNTNTHRELFEAVCKDVQATVNKYTFL